MRLLLVAWLFGCTSPEEDAFISISEASCDLAVRCTDWYTDAAACLAATERDAACTVDPALAEDCAAALAAQTCEEDGSLPDAPASCAQAWSCTEAE